MFAIEDELHGEPGAEFATRDEAMAELQRLATLPWDEPPNRAPCMSWETCGRNYSVVEYDQSCTPWRQCSVIPMIEMSSKGVKWLA
ncbi:hypothetical protein [Sphingomonas sp. RB1R13]|uniref:hypothetical protein n=1 Tax=Sphingomonas sp. RB1R13 TaxID=3096159 RepID=UPI002FC5EFD3